MKIFRPILILEKYDKTARYQSQKGEFGIDGMLFKVNNDTVFKYDYSNAYRIQGTKLVLNLKEAYTPIVVDSKHVGIQELNESMINIGWFEKDVDIDLVIKGWNKYKNIIPFNKIVGYLVARDILLIEVSGFINTFPSWEICLTLSMYMMLSKEIDGFKNRLNIATEIGDQIRGSIKKLDHRIRNGTFKYTLLDDMLEKMHSLSDELALVYHIRNLGYNVRFGSVGETDFFINGVPCEHKSRFPDISSAINMKLPEHFNYSDALNSMIFEIKKVKKALAKSEIFFNNLSRVVPAINFPLIVEINRHNFDTGYFNFLDMFANFEIMMSTVMRIHEKEKVIVPYIKLVTSDPKIISFPLSERIYESIIEEKKRKIS